MCANISKLATYLQRGLFVNLTSSLLDTWLSQVMTSQEKMISPRLNWETKMDYGQADNAFYLVIKSTHFANSTIFVWQAASQRSPSQAPSSSSSSAIIPLLLLFIAAGLFTTTWEMVQVVEPPEVPAFAFAIVNFTEPLSFSGPLVNISTCRSLNQRNEGHIHVLCAPTCLGSVH